MTDPLIVIQARMGSNRFPGKINALLHGIPLIGWIAQAARQVSPHVVVALPNEWKSRYVAITGTRQFQPLEAAEDDVLGRFAECVNNEAEYVHWRDDRPIVRLTADCPMHSPDVIRQTVEAFRPEMGYLFSHWLWRLPKGHEVEVFTRDLLLQADKEATADYDREHVTPWMRRETYDRFALHHQGVPIAGMYTDVNLCVDTVDDLHRLEALP